MSSGNNFNMKAEKVICELLEIRLPKEFITTFSELGIYGVTFSVEPIERAYYVKREGGGGQSA